jgi:NAD(P)-dependent dehydrogenase (short-subunit alcohol dehydrogenase family)
VADFDGKVALVTGGGRGIGAAVGALLMHRGAQVASFDLDASGSPDGAVQVEGDATDSRSVADAVARVEADVGPLDAVVCCAGTAGESLRTVDVSDDEWRRVFALNCDGVFYFNREAAKVMVPRGRGTIIFTGATASIRGREGFSAFSGAKFALRALAQSMARELGPQGVHVAHTIIDGAIDTEWIAKNFPQRHALKDQDGLLNPDHIADAYWMLHSQPRDAWTHELDLRPWMEKMA